MESDIILGLIGLFQAIAVAVISRNEFKRKKRETLIEQKVEKREQRRGKEMLLTMQLVSSNIKLSVATAKAVRDHHTNGNMESALEEAENADVAYRGFIQEIAAAEVVKI